MPVSVHCPSCSKELLADDALIGKLASCPHCQSQFPVTMSATRAIGGGPAPAAVPHTTPRVATPPVTASVTASSVPLAKPLNVRTAPSLLQAAVDTAPAEAQAHPVPPTATNLYPPGHSPSPVAKPVATANPTPVATPTAKTFTTPRPAPVASASPRPSARPSREARPARFIPADASATRVELGHDGQLPVLQLEESSRADVDPQRNTQTNPWLLVAALVFSFGMSAVLLFVETDRAPTERATKRSARTALETYYLTPATQPQPYRQLLAQALQAYNKGDYATERRRYKQVLDLLHAENNDPLSGLTGQVSAANPPHDRHLEELLSTLVDD